MLIFDLDGTLIDSNGVWVEVDKTFLARRNTPYTKEYYQGVAHTTLYKCAEFTRDYLHLEESCEAIIAEWMDLVQDAYRHVALKPHVREYLDRCRASGRRMVLFTACVPEHCQAALDRHGLLSEITRTISEQKVSIIATSSHTAEDRVAVMRFTFEVSDIKQLGYIISVLRGIEGVYDVFRVTSGG